MKITVELHCYYGRKTFYPRCEQSLLFAKLLKHKTLTSRDIDLIKAIGFEVQCIYPAI